MPIEIIHVSDIHLGSGESHGRLNPVTGLNIRLEDFAAALAKVVDYAIDNHIDVFLFTGDAYKNASPEPIYQATFARQLKRLSASGIQTVLVVGNHDQLLRGSASHSMSVFQSLEVPGVLVLDRPSILTLDTAHGALQLIGIPYVNRHQLVTLEKYRSLSQSAIDKAIVEHIDALLKGYYDELDPAIPAVVTAHMTVDRAVAGIEQELLVGYTLTFPTDMFIDEHIDYVALGHVHKHQVIRKTAPAIVYSGSIERVDFGEQNEDKGFVHVSLARQNTTYQFHSIGPRPFATVDADLTSVDNLTERLCELIAKQIVPGCVLRVRYRLKQQQLKDIDEELIRHQANAAVSLRLQPEVVPDERRTRLPQLNESSVTSPLQALDTYLSEVAPDRKERLLLAARELMEQLEKTH